MPDPIRVALAGNPNADKSTIFNALTGGNQHVGNWPGKTVEKMEGRFTLGGQAANVVDLPGTYSLSAYSAEEVITRDYLLRDRPDVVVAVVDAANLERNLYLVVQLIELGAPVIVALNMADIAAGRGLSIRTGALADRLGVPVVSTTATQGRGLDDLKAAILDRVTCPSPS